MKHKLNNYIIKDLLNVSQARVICSFHIENLGYLFVLFTPHNNKYFPACLFGWQPTNQPTHSREKTPEPTSYSSSYHITKKKNILFVGVCMYILYYTQTLCDAMCFSKSQRVWYENGIHKSWYIQKWYIEGRQRPKRLSHSLVFVRIRRISLTVCIKEFFFYIEVKWFYIPYYHLYHSNKVYFMFGFLKKLL